VWPAEISNTCGLLLSPEGLVRAASLLVFWMVSTPFQNPVAKSRRSVAPPAPLKLWRPLSTAFQDGSIPWDASTFPCLFIPTWAIWTKEFGVGAETINGEMVLRLLETGLLLTDRLRLRLFEITDNCYVSSLLRHIKCTSRTRRTRLSHDSLCKSSGLVIVFEKETEPAAL
jgi:hypothetical protein